jgi:serine/threonine-protein kinase
MRAIFESVHEMTPHTRAAAVATACGDDSELRREVLDLLVAEERMGSFLENGVARVVAPDARHGDRIGPYEITGILASGGMGDVYRARDTTLGREVALTLLPDVFLADPARVARFRREAQILASLNHPHIATIYGLEDMDGGGALADQESAGKRRSACAPRHRRAGGGQRCRTVRARLGTRRE